MTFGLLFRRLGRLDLALILCAAFAVLALPRGAQADPVTDYNVAVEFYKQQRWDLAGDACAEFIKKYPTHERAATVRLYWAQALLHLQKFKEAREQFQLFLQQAPQHADRPLALYRIGESSYFLGDYAAAQQDLQQFLNQYPQHDLAEWAWVYLGESQLREKNPAAAAQSFQTALTRFPKSRLKSEAEFGLATALQSQQQPQRAIEIFQRIAAEADGPRAADAQFQLAATEFDQQQFARSAAAFQELATKFPQHRLVPAAHLNAGYALYYLSRFPDAIAEFQNAAANAEHHSIAEYWIGLSEKSQGDFAKAAEIFARLFNEKLDLPADLAQKVTFQWGDSEYRQAHFDKAIELFLRTAKNWPQGELADDSLHAACEAALQAGELQQAQQLNQQFLSTYPMSGLLHVQELLAGRVLIAVGDQAAADSKERTAAYDQAVKTLTHVVETSNVDQTRDFAHFQLARIAEREGRNADVIAELKPLLAALTKEKAVAGTSSNYADMLLLNANAELRLGQAEAALSDYQKLLSLAPRTEEKLAGYAGIVSALATLQRGKELRETLPEFDQLDTKDARFGKSVLAAGDLAFDQKAWETADDCFQAVVNRGPENPYYLPALSGLAHTKYELAQYAVAADDFARLHKSALPDEVLASHAAYMQALARQQAEDPKQALQVYQSAAAQFTQVDHAAALTSEQIEVAKNAYRCEKGGARVARELQQTKLADQLYESAYRELKLLPAADQKELDLLINEWADLSYNAKDYQRSDELYQLLVKERPDSELADDARLILAESLRFSGKKEAATEAFRQLVNDSHSDEFVQQRSLLHLLDLYAEAGQWAEVVSTSEQLSRTFPENSHELYATYRKGEGQLQLRQYSEAAKTLGQVREQISTHFDEAPPWWTESWLLLAEAQYWLKEYAAMEETLSDLKSKAPDSPLLYRADAILGRALENRARFPEARQAYMKVIDSPQGRGTETAAEAQFRIAESFLKENNLPVALREYYKVYAGYDAPKYEAAALFQAAACDTSMKHFPEAADTLRKLIAEFPESEFAEKANARLQELKVEK